LKASSTLTPFCAIANSRQEASEGGKITNKLFCPWSDLVPYWIELPAHDGIERSEVGVIYIEIIKVEL
jgi:hypothetical protein